MMDPSTIHRQSGSVALAVLLSLVSTVIVGGMLYYTLKRYEVAQALQVAQVEQAAREQQAVATGRLFAQAGSAVIRTDPAAIQSVLSGGLPTKQLLDAVVVNQDDVIIAAQDRSRIGQRLQDQALGSQRTAKREAIASAADGARTLTVLEPLTDQGGVVAWAWFRYAWPADSGTLRAPVDRMEECARLLAPTFVLLLLSLLWVIRSATSSMRAKLQELVGSLSADAQPEDQPIEMEKAA